MIWGDLFFFLFFFFVHNGKWERRRNDEADKGFNLLSFYLVFFSISCMKWAIKIADVLHFFFFAFFVLFLLFNLILYIEMVGAILELCAIITVDDQIYDLREAKKNKKKKKESDLLE